MVKITNDINYLKKIINNDGVILMQVDTIFGLICSGLSEKAIEKIEKIKNRQKPSFGFFVKDVNIAKKYAKINQQQELCFNKIFPGYFTIILEATEFAEKNIINRALGKYNNLTTIGIRVPNNNFCLDFLQNFDFPLVATSANISGQKPAKLFEDIDKTIISSVDAIYYNANIKMAGLNSTIINIIDVNDAKIIRKGSGDIDILDGLIQFQK